MRYFIAIAGRRWPVEETFKTGKDVLGWDQCQARVWDALCRHTALSALAQLRQVAIRNALCGLIDLPPLHRTRKGEAPEHVRVGISGPYQIVFHRQVGRKIDLGDTGHHVSFRAADLSSAPGRRCRAAAKSAHA